MIKTLFASFLLLIATGPTAVLCADENHLKPLDEAFAAWADGRPEDAVTSLQYEAARSSDTVLTLAAIKELSAILSELGRNKEALAWLAKAEILAPEDPYLSFEKGWNFLSLGNYTQARSAFEKTLTLTGEGDMVSQARFGLAGAEAHLGGPSAAAASLQTIYHKYPYLLSPVAEVISAQYEALHNRQHAITFLKEALTYDPRNIQAEIDLARLYYKSGDYVPAWQTYYTLSELDPKDGFAAHRAAKLVKHVTGKLDNLLYWNRMSGPAHSQPLKYAGRDFIRIGLFSDAGHEPALLTEFGFIASAGFSIADSRLGIVGGGKAGMQCKVRYNPVNKIYEITDSMGSVIHSTRNSFRLNSQISGGVILIKNPEPVAQRGVNRGDREVAGDLNVIVKDTGFRLVNTVPLEATVPSVVTSLAGGSKLMEELKALAIVVRSQLAYFKNVKKHDDADYDLCDSPHCIAFPGLQMENEAARKAAEVTLDEVLSGDGAPAMCYFHTACGGATEDGVSDKGRALTRLTPFNLYNLTIKAPPEELLCLTDDRTATSDAVWTLMLEPEWIENRLNRGAGIGHIKSMTVLKRSANGKAETLRVDGTAGSTILKGFDAISQALTAGTLRSPLFTMRPVFEGKYPKYFLLRGIGTGDGRGYCLLGGHGMAGRFAAKYADILKHYFPRYKVIKLPERE